MKQMIVAGNWKMHTTASTAAELAGSIAHHAGVQGGMEKGVSVILCPPFLSMHTVCSVVASSHITVGAQDCHHEPQGAFTGDVSAAMVRDMGCTSVIVGHSERRRYHHETDELIAAKVLAARAADLVPIICVGETLEERQRGVQTDVIRRQLSTILEIAGVTSVQAAIIAYEPVWAIGTGLAATPEQAQEVHAMIDTLLREHGVEIPILYGGSVTAENAATLFACPDIHGALVGGASLKPGSFADIVAEAGNVMS